MSPRPDLDSAAYSPVAQLNELLSTSAHLSRLSDIRARVALHKSALDRQLADEGLADDDVRAKFERVVLGHAELEELMAETERLQVSARETEQGIKRMTGDIKRLDRTKENLTQSITILKRLQMLTAAYNQLTALVDNRRYGDMVATLQAVMELMAYFRPYRSIGQVAALSKQIGDTEVRISQQIFADFETAIADGKSLGPRVNLADACAVLDAIGKDEREKLIRWYCTQQLREYRTIFKSTDEAGSLENIPRRYAYLKRLLKRHSDTLARYFDPEWKVAEALAKEFCVATREDVNALLSQEGAKVDVFLLLKTLEEALEFEQYLQKRFPHESFANAISAAYQPHLSVWIEHQSRIMADKMSQYRRDRANILSARSSDGATADSAAANDRENGTSGSSSAAAAGSGSHDNADDHTPDVLPSSMDMFRFYRQVLAQTAKLSTGRPLVELSRMFGRWLVVYCRDVLASGLPRSLGSVEDVRAACLILNTADYGANTTYQLEQRLVDEVDDSLREEINMEEERNRFTELVSDIISALVSLVDAAADASWREMVNTNWHKLAAVGDVSTYMRGLVDAVKREMAVVLAHITKDVHVRTLCERVVESLANAFMRGAAATRPISEVAAEQMLLDLYVLKDMCLQLPAIAHPDKEVHTSYANQVTRTLTRVETVLKVILTRSDPAEGLVQNYFYLIGDKSSDNFIKVLELKGLSRPTQARLLELFYSHMKAHDNLIEEAPLLKKLQLTRPGIHTRSHTPSLHSSPLNAPVSEASRPPLPLGNLREGFERFTHQGTEGVNRINTNFKQNLGRLFKRDSMNRSPM